MTTIIAKISLILFLTNALLLSGCLSQNTNTNTAPIEPTQTIYNQVKSSNWTSMYGEPSGVELVKENRSFEEIPEAILMGPAHILAADSKNYAKAYGIVVA